MTKQKLELIEQDCFLCEKTFKSYKYQSACNECEAIHKAIKPSTIKASQLAKSMGISFKKM